MAVWQELLQHSAAMYVLIAIRVSGLLLLAPPLASMGVPMTMRGLIVLALAMMLWLAQAGRTAPALDADLVWLAILEFGNGAMMALGAHLAFACFQVGARLLDVQMGFGMGQVLDPTSHSRMPILTAAFSLLAPVLFVLSDCHHLLLRGLALGLDRFPPGQALPAATFGAALMTQAQGMFNLGLAMVAPVVLGLILIEMLLGVLARNLPQMNVFVLGIPLKLVVGLAALSAWIMAASKPMGAVFDHLFRGWQAALN